MTKQEQIELYDEWHERIGEVCDIIDRLVGDSYEDIPDLRVVWESIHNIGREIDDLIESMDKEPKK